MDGCGTLSRRPDCLSIPSRTAYGKPPDVCSPKHTTLAEAERYTEEADQAGLAEDAVIKLEGHKANRIAQTISVSLGKTPKTRGKSDRKE